MKIIILLLFATMLCSCATMFGGSRKKVMFDSEIDVPVTMNIEGQRYRNVTFPHVMKIKRGFSPTIIKFEAEGYETEMLKIEKDFNAISLLNLLNGALGFAIDAATGAMTQPQYNYYEIMFVKKPSNYVEE